MVLSQHGEPSSVSCTWFERNPSTILTPATWGIYCLDRCEACSFEELKSSRSREQNLLWSVWATADNVHSCVDNCLRTEHVCVVTRVFWEVCSPWHRTGHANRYACKCTWTLLHVPAMWAPSLLHGNLQLCCFFFFWWSGGCRILMKHSNVRAIPLTLVCFLSVSN